jgi:hypothetical protein
MEALKSLNLEAKKANIYFLLPTHKIQNIVEAPMFETIDL